VRRRRGGGGGGREGGREEGRKVGMVSAVVVWGDEDDWKAGPVDVLLRLQPS